MADLDIEAIMVYILLASIIVDTAMKSNEVINYSLHIHACYM